MVDSLLELITERESQKSYKSYRGPLCDKCYSRGRDKHDSSCGYIFLWVGSK